MTPHYYRLLLLLLSSSHFKITHLFVIKLTFYVIKTVIELKPTCNKEYNKLKMY